MPDLNGKRVAILATDGFEEDELLGPKKALEDAGARTTVISIHPGEIRACKNRDWSSSISVDLTVEEANGNDFDALLIPGGVMNPDKMRVNPRAVDLVRQFIHESKPVGAICHGPWMLVEANAVQGRRVTSWPSLETDLRNAGASWVDEVVVVDNGLVTSRKPDDIPEFSRKLIEEIAEGVHSNRPEIKATMR